MTATVEKAYVDEKIEAAAHAHGSRDASLIKKIVRSHYKAEVDDTGETPTVCFRDDDGKLVFNDDGDPASAADIVGRLRKELPEFFTPPQANGSSVPDYLQHWPQERRRQFIDTYGHDVYRRRYARDVQTEIDAKMNARRAADRDKLGRFTGTRF